MLQGRFFTTWAPKDGSQSGHLGECEPIRFGLPWVALRSRQERRGQGLITYEPTLPMYCENSTNLEGMGSDRRLPAHLLNRPCRRTSSVFLQVNRTCVSILMKDGGHEETTVF